MRFNEVLKEKALKAGYNHFIDITNNVLDPEAQTIKDDFCNANRIDNHPSLKIVPFYSEQLKRIIEE